MLRRFDREPLQGYINPLSFLQPGGIELLSEEGKVSLVPYAEIKTIAFVREFGAASPGPERRAFLTRPKTAGLWVSLRFRDGETLEGVMPNNLLQLEHYGFTIIPPDSSSNQRIFAPRSALVEVEVLGVIGSPLNRRKPKAAAKEQIGLFQEDSAANE